MLTVFFRTLILYAVPVLAIRLMGKRQIGQLRPYEFVPAPLVADLAASPMENVGTPLLYGVVPILTMLFLYGVLTLLSVKCGLDEEWLWEQIGPLGYTSASQLLLVSLDGHGRLFLQGMGEKAPARLIRAQVPEAVKKCGD